MAELLTDTLLLPDYIVENHSPGHMHKQQKVTEILDWVQYFGVYMAIISFKEPSRIPNLIGYQSLIIQSTLYCQEGCCIVYDRCFQLKASAVTITEWSCIDITM